MLRSDKGRHARARMAERLARPRDSVPFELSAVRRRRRPPPAGGRGTRLRRGAASRVRPSTRSRGLALSFRQILDGSRALAAFTHILRGMAWHTPPLAQLRHARASRARPLRGGNSCKGDYLARLRGIVESACSPVLLRYAAPMVSGVPERGSGKRSPLEHKPPPRRIAGQSLVEGRESDLLNELLPWVTLPVFCWVIA